jgi:hypothetical protein
MTNLGNGSRYRFDVVCGHILNEAAAVLDDEVSNPLYGLGESYMDCTSHAVSSGSAYTLHRPHATCCPLSQFGAILGLASSTGSCSLPTRVELAQQHYYS